MPQWAVLAVVNETARILLQASTDPPLARELCTRLVAEQRWLARTTAVTLAGAVTWQARELRRRLPRLLVSFRIRDGASVLPVDEAPPLAVTLGRMCAAAGSKDFDVAGELFDAFGTAYPDQLPDLVAALALAAAHVLNERT